MIGRGESAVARTSSAVLKYVIACLCASVLCADLVGWGDNLLVIRPFAMLGNVIIFNNMASALLLAPFILAAVYPRVKKGRMLYEDMMPEMKPRPMAMRITGFAMLIAGEGGAWIFGNLLSTGFWIPQFLPAWMMTAPYDKPIAIIVSPFILLAFAGLFLM